MDAQACARSLVDDARSLVDLSSVVEQGPHHDVGETVSVYVPGRSYSPAEGRGALVALASPVGDGAQAGRRPLIGKGCALISLALCVPVCPDDDIVETVAVYVSRSAHRDTEVRKLLVDLSSPVRFVAQARCG